MYAGIRFANQSNKRNQDLLAHLRIQLKVLDVISKVDKAFNDNFNAESDPELLKVMEACYNFLQQVRRLISDDGIVV